MNTVKPWQPGLPKMDTTLYGSVTPEVENGTTSGPKTEKLGTSPSQIPVEAIEAIGRIFEEGRVKYGRDNWKKGLNNPTYQEERLNHAIVHLFKYANGDTSEDHLAKVAWFCVTQLHFDSIQTDTSTLNS